MALGLASGLRQTSAHEQVIDLLDISTYTLQTDRLPSLPSVVEPSSANIERTTDGDIAVVLDNTPDVTGYKIYRNRCYVTTVRPPPCSSDFSFDGIAGPYCLAAFVEIRDHTHSSICCDLCARMASNSRRPYAVRDT